MVKVRLDTLLHQRGLFDSRSRAAASVMAGEVRLGGEGGARASKPGQMVADDVEVAVDEKPRYVSRGGVKLENAVAGFGLARSGFLLARAVIGMALGFAYFVVDNAALAMGSFGGYPPLLAAWAPFLLFLLVGETVLIRTEE